MSGTLLSVRGLNKTFADGTEALGSIDFEVSEGEGVVLLGHNGSGKSTLLRCLTRFEQPTSGTVSFQGQDLTRMNHRQLRVMRRRMGMVFQHFHLIHNVSVFQNVLFGALGRTRTTLQAFAPFASNALREEALDSLDRVGLADLARRRADQLSGGQQQRAAIARMLMQRPEIVLADEPIASLDPRAGREVMDLLWEVVRERNLTVVCVLHQMEIAREYGERLIGLKMGEVVFDRPGASVSREEIEALYDKEPVEKPAEPEEPEERQSAGLSQRGEVP